MVLQAGVLEVLDDVGAAGAVAVLLRELLGDGGSEEQLATVAGTEAQEAAGKGVAGGGKGVAADGGGGRGQRREGAPCGEQGAERALAHPAGGDLKSGPLEVLHHRAMVGEGLAQRQAEDLEVAVSRALI